MRHPLGWTFMAALAACFALVGPWFSQGSSEHADGEWFRPTRFTWFRTSDLPAAIPEEILASIAAISAVAVFALACARMSFEVERAGRLIAVPALIGASAALAASVLLVATMLTTYFVPSPSFLGSDGWLHWGPSFGWYSELLSSAILFVAFACARRGKFET